MTVSRFSFIMDNGHCIMDNDWHKHSATPNSHSLVNFRLSRGMLNLIFIMGLIFLSIFSITSYYQLKNLMIANTLVIHTHKVIETLDTSLFDIIDLESRQRGYIIRGLNQYLSENDQIKANLKQKLDKLTELTQDNPQQNKRVLHFIELAETRLNLLNQIMQLKAANKLTTEEGNNALNLSQEFSNRVKDAAQEIKSVEYVLLAARNDNAVSWAEFSTLILVGGYIFSILFLIIAFILANIELSKRKTTEYYNQNIQIRLRKIIESASDMIAAFDKDNCFIIFNEAYQREFKRIFNKSIAVNMSLDDAFMEIPASKQHLIQAWKDSLQNNEASKTIEFILNEEKNIYEMNSNLIQNGDKEIKGIVHSIRNITKRIQEHTELQDSYEKQALGIKELQDKNEQITLLVEMSDIMLACSSQEELSDVMARYSQRLLKFSSGYLFIMHPSKNYLEKATFWGTPNNQEATFTPDECWAIRLGRIHHVGASHDELICNHVILEDQQSLSLLCVPLMAQNDIYGLLYLEIGQQQTTVMDENQRLLITAFAELTALALANVRLRENLRYQSIRDPLTGLYNRRYLEDFLFKQIHQAERSKVSLAVLMLDLDHFKKINDTFGHDAGDLALKEVGQILQEDIRLGDVAARYGGEEFVILFYDIDGITAKKKAEALRMAIAKLQIKYGAHQVGQINISIGISLYPKDARNAADLIESADKALYQAKHNGRNQVVLYSDTKP